MMAVHKHKGEPIVSVDECIARHARELKFSEPLYKGALTNSEAYEDDDVCEIKPMNPRQRYDDARRACKPVIANLAELSPAQFETEIVRFREILDNFMESLENPVTSTASADKASEKGNKDRMEDKGKDEAYLTVRLYNSMNAPLSPHVQLQLSMLYGGEQNPVTAVFPIVQLQLPGSNQCGPMVCSYMAELISGVSPASTVFAKASAQRKWLAEVLQAEKIRRCPKRLGRKAVNELITAKDDLLVTVEDAILIRSRLADLPNRPIIGCKA
ncbi:uncharacterized protein LOC129594528 [Paramacrobiotus metropolitanus]|uniref:uncharacterized protein LOC129594528 n=1 Tax=Paramacrobiotus metropolitanus TaxID=2943436 RepID=UPI002445CEFD|nr:uncharacterized protein LOC129594528 [Paramacrobiotus metropolitanus]